MINGFLYANDLLTDGSPKKLQDGLVTGNTKAGLEVLDTQSQPPTSKRGAEGPADHQ